MLSFLKAEGLALKLESSHNNYMNLFTLFEIKIQLTQKGLANPDQVHKIFPFSFCSKRFIVIILIVIIFLEKVVNAVFATLQMLREFGVNERIFTEVQTVSKLTFDNQDK